RRAMGEAAVAAARAVGYCNAGTIEFLVDQGRFHFLEMNTRIQVEHPVTELVTGIDLVQWQLRIASGESIPFGQDDIRIDGHAIECRITSEDTANGFLPATGTIELLEAPAGPGVRWDAGVAEGDEVSLFYDPLLAKLIVHGSDRAAAIERMGRALAELRIAGLETSVSLHARIMQEPDFRAGDLDIRYLDTHPDVLRAMADAETRSAVAITAVLLEDAHRKQRSVGRVQPASGARGGWRAQGWRS
ncbi:MAG: hypothetical protein L0271_06795, partial [Gemmatimonadetes bacterium]|nr:hypothetical protein [Gemmatimonadota bacterium]